MENLDGWIFTYSHTTEKWSACHKDYINDLWNNYNSTNVIRGYNIESLIQLIYKYKGDTEEIWKKVK